MRQVFGLAAVLAVGSVVGIAQARTRTLAYPGWSGKGSDSCYTNTANWSDAGVFDNLDNVPRVIAEGKELAIDLPDFDIYNPAIVFTLRGASAGKITLNGLGHVFSMPAPRDADYPHVYTPRTVAFAAGTIAWTSPLLASLEISNTSENMLKPVFSWTDADITFERSPTWGGRLVFDGGTYDFAPDGCGAQSFIINDGYVETFSDVRFLAAETHLPAFDFRGAATNGYCVVSGGVFTVSGDMKYGYTGTYQYSGTNVLHVTGGARASMVGNNATVYFGKPEDSACRHQVWLVEGEGTTFDMRGQSTFAFRGDSTLVVSNGATFVAPRYVQFGASADARNKGKVRVEGKGTRLLFAPTYNNPTTPTYAQVLLGSHAQTSGSLTINDGTVEGVPEYTNGVQITLGHAAGSVGEMTVNGGAVTLGGGDQGLAFVVGKEGRGVYTQTGGRLTALKPVNVGGKSSADCVGTVNLDGGVFEPVQMLGKYGLSEGGLAVPTLTADGGRLVPRSAGYGTASKPFLSGFNAAALGVAGLTVDTDGKDVYVAQAFGDKTGASGRLVKTGAGALTLTGAQTVSAVVVEEGTLAVAAQAEDWTSSLVLRPGTSLTLAGTPSLLKLGGLVATNATLVLDPKDAVEVGGTLELVDVKIEFTSAPALNDADELFTCQGEVSSATVRTIRRAIAKLATADGTHAIAEMTTDPGTGKTHIKVHVKEDLGPIGPEGTTTWRGTTSVWEADANWSGGVPTAAQKAAFGALSQVRMVEVSAGAVVGALSFADTGYRLSGGDLEIAAEKGAAEIAVTEGAHEIALPLLLDTQVSVPVSAGAALTLSGGIADGGLATSGDGLVTVSGTCETDGLRLGGGTVTVAHPESAAKVGAITLACAENDAATVLRTDSDVEASSFNAKSGVLVKRGTGALNVDVSAGTTLRLANGTNGPDPGGSNGLPKSTDVQSFAADGSSPSQGVAGFTIAEGEVRFDGSASASVPTLWAGGCMMVGMSADVCGAQPTLTLDHAYLNARDNLPSATHFFHGWRAGVTGNAVVSPVIRILNGATLYCDTYQGGLDAKSPAQPLVAMTNGTLTSSYASHLSRCAPNGGATMVFRLKDSRIYAGNNTIKPIQIDGVVDLEGENSVLAAVNNALGGVYLNAYSKGRVFLHDGGLFHVNGFHLAQALAHDITFAFDGTEWRGADAGSYSITNGPNAANGHLIVEMIGRGAIFNPGAGNTVTTETAFSGEGGLQVRSGTFGFAPGTYGHGGTTHVSAGAAVDLSQAGKIVAARFGGDGTVSGGSFGSLTIDPGTTDGTVAEAPTFASCSSDGRIRVDFGLSADFVWTLPYPTGLLVARFTGKVPSAGQFRLVNAGRNMGGVFSVSDDGTVTMDVKPKGLVIIVR